VGKAKNLKKRVNSYFQKQDLDIKTQTMLTHINDIDFLVTDTEVEALILENTLIKQYQPRYNIRLKDAKSHSYIKITHESYPRAVIARRKTSRGRYYGPFVSAQERDDILHFLRRTFKLRTCKTLRKKPCLRYHIRLCDAPCINGISHREYQKKIIKATTVLTGKSDRLLPQLEGEMKEYALHHQFERAMQIRDEITAIQRLQEKQKMQREKQHNEDIINYQIKEDTIYLMLFNIYRGTLSQKNEFVFDYQKNFFEAFLTQYYADNPIPKEIIIPESISEPAHQYLEYKKGQKVRITIPKKGEKKQLLDLVVTNIETSFFADINKVHLLKTRLHLQEDPLVIECFDISHLSGTSTVGSMVQFRNGKPDKNNYRRFRIRTVDGVDDVAAIAEVVRRRYHRLLKENLELPNLIIIDGGRGQLNCALYELELLRVKIPIIAIAKQFEEIYLPGEPHPLRLSKQDKALHFIQEIRDEAHRFALKYNRLLRKKKMIE
jgi:excinuclease ABC subunit C